MNSVRKPYLGEVVHYRSFGTPDGEFTSVCRVAVVTELNTGGDGRQYGVVVLNPTGIFFNTVDHDEQQRLPGTIHGQH